MPPDARTSFDQLGPTPGRRSRTRRKDDTVDQGWSGDTAPSDFEWIVYCRISDDREGRGLGVARQEKAGRRLHKQANLGGTILTVLVDNDLTANDKSGRYKPRPDYNVLCQMLRERPGRRGVIAWHTDRLHRTPRELEDFIDVVEQTSAPIRTVQAGPIDLTTPSGRAVARTLCAWARFESEHKSERIRDKVREQAESGAIYGGGPRPYGYNRIYQGEGKRRKILRDEIIPEEAAVIRECARKLLSGDRLRTVTRWLNKEGHKSSTGRPWSQQALRLMMMSGRIAGLREHHGEAVATAVWKPIITVEEHERLRALLDANERSPGSRVRKHYLSGFVYCSDCADKGVKMRVTPQHQTLKYKCPPDVGGCNGRVIGLADLENFVGALMVVKLTDPDTLAEMAARDADQSVEVAALVDRIETDERRLAKLQAALDEEEEDDLPEVVASIGKIRKRLGDLRGQLGQAMSAGSAVPRESFRELGERWESLDLDQKRTLLGMFVDRILIHPAVRGLAKFDPRRVEVIPVHRRGQRKDGEE